MIILGIIVALFIFTFIVFIHELGHFSVARFFGVRVEEFGIGIPPRAKKLFKDKTGTLYSLNWLPIGGFVKLTGESINSFLIYNKKGELYTNEALMKDLEDDKDIYDKSREKIGENIKKGVLKKLKENSADYNLMNKPAWQQSLIILAGVFMNFVLAGIIFSILFFVGVKPIGINSKIDTDLNVQLIPTYQQALESGVLLKDEGILLYPTENSIAYFSGIKNGDLLISVNSNMSNDITQLQELIVTNRQHPLIFEIMRENETLFLTVTPSSEGKIGSYLSENISINEDFEYKYGLVKSIQNGFSETYNQSLLTVKGIGLLFSKIFYPETKEERQEAIAQVSGPIGIVDFIANSIDAGFIFLLILTAIISINLGVFNLLPIPALDGGRFFFIITNGIMKKIFGKKVIGDNIQNFIHVGFFIFLIALSVLIAYNDVMKIISE